MKDFRLLLLVAAVLSLGLFMSTEMVPEIRNDKALYPQCLMLASIMALPGAIWLAYLGYNRICQMRVSSSRHHEPVLVSAARARAPAPRRRLAQAPATHRVPVGVMQQRVSPPEVRVEITPVRIIPDAPAAAALPSTESVQQRVSPPEVRVEITPVRVIPDAPAAAALPSTESAQANPIVAQTSPERWASRRTNVEATSESIVNVTMHSATSPEPKPSAFKSRGAIAFKPSVKPLSSSAPFEDASRAHASTDTHSHQAVATLGAM